MTSFSLPVSYLLLKCIGDGVFDKLSNEDVIKSAWDSARKFCKGGIQPVH